MALSRGDLTAADELLETWESAIHRAQSRVAQERRRIDPEFERARSALQARKAARYQRY